MTKERELFKLKDVNKFLNTRFGKNYKFISLKRTSKNYVCVCIEENGKKICLEFTPYDLKMFEIVENNKLTKVSENGIRLDWLKHLVGVYGEVYLKSVEEYCSKRNFEIYKEYNDKIEEYKSALENVVAEKLRLTEELKKVSKAELIIRTAIEDRNKEMLEEIDFNNNLVGYLNDCEDKKKKGARFMSKLIKDLVGEVKETSEENLNIKVTETEVKREVDTTGEMNCSNVK